MITATGKSVVETVTARAYRYDDSGAGNVPEFVVTLTAGNGAGISEWGNSDGRFSTGTCGCDDGVTVHGYRFYSPSMGRFLNRDPIKEAGGLNLYVFVGNDPVNHVDYIGLNALESTASGYYSQAIPSKVMLELGWTELLSKLRSVAHVPRLRIGDYDNPSFRSRGGRGTIRLPYDYTGEEVLHELTHAYNHNRISKLMGGRKDEGMAYVVQWSAGRNYTDRVADDLHPPTMRLMRIELLLMKFDSFDWATIDELRRSWRGLWQYWGHPQDYSIVKLGEIANSNDFENVEAHYGFRLNCDKAARVFNDMLGGSCIKFTCDLHDGAIFGRGILIQPRNEIQPTFRD